MTTPTTSTPRRAGAGEMAWMVDAGCLGSGDLPWTADPDHTTTRELRAMGQICQDCPVLSECAGFAREQRVTAGFWAGRHRDPNAPSLVAGMGWASEPLPGLGGAA